MINELTKKNINEILEGDSNSVVVDVYASWCGPCSQLKPVFAEVASELKDSYTFAQLNVDDERDLAIQYGITSIPTILFIKGGKLIAKEMGYINKATLVDKIKSHLG